MKMSSFVRSSFVLAVAAIMIAADVADAGFFPSWWSRPKPAPEIDPAMIPGVLALLAGGFAYITDRRR